MEVLYGSFNILYQLMDSFSFMILSAIGLAIIFGMMGIVNLAHGEFIMLGAYITTLTAHANVPLFLAVIIGSVGVGIYGLIVDRFIMRHLYGRPMDSVVATWGLSMVMSQGMLLLMGPSLQGVSTPLGSFTVGNFSYSSYRVLLVVVAILLLVLIYWLFMYTKIGLRARATMQNHEIASSLGANTNIMFSSTFVLGSMLAGLTGALFAPTASISPQFGGTFLMESFVTVIVGGANPLVGTILSGGALGVVHSSLSAIFGTFIGRLGLLIVAIIVIRILPTGFSGLVEKRVMK